jgi:hypothetical protein
MSELTKAQEAYRQRLVADAVQKRAAKPLSILNPAKVYVPSHLSDIRLTFQRFRELQAAEASLHEANMRAIQENFTKRRADTAR